MQAAFKYGCRRAAIFPRGKPGADIRHHIAFFDGRDTNESYTPIFRACIFLRRALLADVSGAGLIFHLLTLPSSLQAYHHAIADFADALMPASFMPSYFL